MLLRDPQIDSQDWIPKGERDPFRFYPQILLRPYTNAIAVDKREILIPDDYYSREDMVDLYSKLWEYRDEKDGSVGLFYNSLRSGYITRDSFKCPSFKRGLFKSVCGTWYVYNNLDRFQFYTLFFRALFCVEFLDLPFYVNTDIRPVEDVVCWRLSISK